jgi:Domain of unknown function (DUF4476)
LLKPAPFLYKWQKPTEISIFERLLTGLKMNLFSFKATVIMVVFAMSSVVAKGQASRFIYLQTENKQPFYVKLDSKLMNSAESGYLIIPKLADNTYAIVIGFYETGAPQITTTIRIRDGNLGLLLKDPGDKNWGLLNLQTLQPLAIKKEFPAEKKEKAGPAVDEFTRILAEVVDEPSIAWALVEPADKESVVPQVKIPAQPKLEELKPAKTDTIQAKKPAVPAATVINTNCKKTATQNEYLKLRKQMAGEANEKNMIRAANKQFLNTCFTTEQVMNLAILFVNEEEKYKFFVAAYPHVSDTNNFVRVKDTLTDNYYKTRLDAMMRVN